MLVSGSDALIHKASPECGIANLRRVMELPTIEQLNLQASPSEIEEWVERFELWCSIRKRGTQNQSALFNTAGRRDLYPLLRNLAFPETPAKLPYESLKSLLAHRSCVLRNAFKTAAILPPGIVSSWRYDGVLPVQWKTSTKMVYRMTSEVSERRAHPAIQAEFTSVGVEVFLSGVVDPEPSTDPSLSSPPTSAVSNFATAHFLTDPP
ncbi:unnamed protein product [Echinostoma caproni]|uniref:Uncharacterized protein n=1 Tax=Echinostoma caproni TaxID=27848 RepID=A0A183AZH8_9TREM|nr:unnamed protein product [Echinostoma caproni]